MSNSHENEEFLDYPEDSLDFGVDVSVEGMESAHEVAHPPCAINSLGSKATALTAKTPADRLDAMGIYSASEIRALADKESIYDANAWIREWVPNAKNEFLSAQRNFDSLRALKAKLPPSVKRAMYAQMQGFRAEALRSKTALSSDASTEAQRTVAVSDYIFGKKLIELAREKGGSISELPRVRAKFRAEAMREAEGATSELVESALRSHEARFIYWRDKIAEAEAHLPFLTKPE